MGDVGPGGRGRDEPAPRSVPTAPTSRSCSGVRRSSGHLLPGLVGSWPDMMPIGGRLIPKRFRSGIRVGACRPAPRPAARHGRRARTGRWRSAADVATLAAEHGTPLFVYDEAHLRALPRGGGGVRRERAIYATKAFLCRAMARLAHEEGCCSTSPAAASCTSRSPPVCPPRVHVPRQQQERRRAAHGDRGRRAHVVVDSFDELDRLEPVASAGAMPAPDVLLRITPGVHAHTHEYIATGQDDSKFGFNLANGDAAGRSSGPAVAVGRPRRAALPHRLERVRRRELRQGAAEVMAGFAARSTCPSSCSAAVSAWPTSRGGGADDHRVGRGGARRLPAARRASAVSVEPGRAIVAAAP